MKEREIYANLRCIPPVMIRIDGRKFKNTLNSLKFEKPYDKIFASTMADAIELFFKKGGLNPTLAYFFSDEISFLFTEVPFNGRIEKLNSIIPSYLSSTLSILLKLKNPISLDSRVIPINKDLIMKYLSWRQDEAWRNCVNSYGYYTLLSNGYNKMDAVKFLKGKKEEDLHELLFEYGINMNDVPTWQRRGIMIYRKPYELLKNGNQKFFVYDKKINKKISSTRKTVVQDWEIPTFKSNEGDMLLNKLLKYEI